MTATPKLLTRVGKYDIGTDGEMYFATYSEGAMSGGIAFKTIREAVAYASKRSGVRSEAQAKSDPLWQMDLRHKLGIGPDSTDALTMLLWSAIYGSDDQGEVEQRLQNHIEELQRALRVIREDA